MSSPAIEIRNVAVFRWSPVLRRRTHLLRGFNWRVGAGEHWVVLGPNGAGKTTLLNLAGATSQPTSGEVEVLGERFGRTDLRVLRERIGFVDSKLAAALRPNLTGMEVVLTGAHGAIFLDRSRVTAEDRKRAAELIAMVSMQRVCDREFRHCSQGERQRLLLARALLSEPELLLLDEPGAGLDLPSREGLIQAQIALARERAELPTVFVTHHLEEIPPATTHALLIANGKSVAKGPIEQVLTSANVSRCFGLEIEIGHRDGRWSAVAA